MTPPPVIWGMVSIGVHFAALYRYDLYVLISKFISNETYHKWIEERLW